ncbi:TetR family transcriptional regulator C-terminal domain-containing protein [Streptomyces olivaceus]|uniref:TetR family transcriptional regulator C-terminal domain-containing protein n=2 Tax=Streptomyces TaxID=1883 RepID=UPI003B97FC8D
MWVRTSALRLLSCLGTGCSDPGGSPRFAAGRDGCSTSSAGPVPEPPSGLVRVRLGSPGARTFDRWEGPIRSGLARMQARGELSERADTAALATALLAAIQGGMLLSQVRRSSTAYRQAVSVVIDHIESYLVR